MNIQRLNPAQQRAILEWVAACAERRNAMRIQPGLAVPGNTLVRKGSTLIHANADYVTQVGDAQ